MKKLFLFLGSLFAILLDACLVLGLVLQIHNENPTTIALFSIGIVFVFVLAIISLILQKKAHLNSKRAIASSIILVILSVIFVIYLSVYQVYLISSIFEIKTSVVDPNPYYDNVLFFSILEFLFVHILVVFTVLSFIPFKKMESLTEEEKNKEDKLISKKKYLLASCITFYAFILSFMGMSYDPLNVSNFWVTSLALNFPLFIINTLSLIFALNGNKKRRFNFASAIISMALNLIVFYAFVSGLLAMTSFRNNYKEGYLVMWEYFTIFSFVSLSLLVPTSILGIVYSKKYSYEEYHVASKENLNSIEENKNVIDRIKELKELLDSNAITEEEYNVLKAKEINKE